MNKNGCAFEWLKYKRKRKNTRHVSYDFRTFHFDFDFFLSELYVRYMNIMCEKMQPSAAAARRWLVSHV